MEPLSVITSISPSQSLITGVWFTVEPFCIENLKCTSANKWDYSIFEYSASGKYSEQHWEGGREGTWKLNGNKIHFEGTRYIADIDENFSETADVYLYKIREEWLILELLTWDEDSDYQQLRVIFMVKPLSDRAHKKVRDWYPGSYFDDK